MVILPTLTVSISMSLFSVIEDDQVGFHVDGTSVLLVGSLDGHLHSGNSGPVVVWPSVCLLEAQHLAVMFAT